MKTKNLIPTAFVVTIIGLFIPRNSFSQMADSSRFGIFGAYTNEYTYFINQMGLSPISYINWVDNHFKNLGAHWTRSNTQLIWNLIEPKLDGKYVWNIFSFPDSVVTKIYDSPAQVEWLGCINFNPSTHNPVKNPTRWKAYLRTVVDKYNGDGSNDLNSRVKVKHWQIGNEIFELTNAGFTSAQYAQVVAMADTAIHSLDANAKICLVAPTSGIMVDTFWVNTITQLSLMNIHFEIVDVHNWVLASQYKMNVLSAYRNLLNSKGYSNVKIWSCENGTYCYQPSTLPFQSQDEQAASLIKRYVWNFANGLEKLMWNNLMEWYQFGGNPSSIYNSMGLIGDGQLNNEPANELNFKRKSYYSYKLLASTIDSYYATIISNNVFHNESNGNYGYIYQDKNTGNHFDIFWTDNDSATYNFTTTSNYQLTEMIPFDNVGNFNTLSFTAGTHNITIYKNKVYLLKKSSVSGIQNTEDKNSLFNIYPNPFSKTVRLELPINNCQIKIFDVLGNIVFEKTLSTKNEMLNLNLPNGLYFYQVKDNKQFIASGKLIVQ